MSDEQKAFFESAGNLKIKSIMNKIEFNTELVRTEGISGVLDPLPNADWPLYKDSKIPSFIKEIDFMEETDNDN